MGFFNPDDVERADVDPFLLPLGQRVQVVISESKLDKVGKDQIPVWAVIFSKGQKKGRLVHFLNGKDAEAEERNLGRIHKTLQLLEVPREEWDDVAENPELVVGYSVLVDVYKDSKGYRQVSLVGIDRSGVTPSDEGMNEYVGVSAGTEVADTDDDGDDGVNY